MKILPLTGFKSIKAFWAFQKLMLGLKMLPAYMAVSFEEFYDRVSEMDLASRETVIREAAALVDLLEEEVAALLAFCTDANGVPYSSENIKNLGPREIHECIVAVSLEISKIKVELISESQKKNSASSLLT